MLSLVRFISTAVCLSYESKHLWANTHMLVLINIADVTVDRILRPRKNQMSIVSLEMVALIELSAVERYTARPLHNLATFVEQKVVK